MERLEIKVAVDTGEDRIIVKEVGLPMDQFGNAAGLIYFHDVQRQRFDCGVLPHDFQHVVEHDSLQRHTLYGPEVH